MIRTHYDNLQVTRSASDVVIRAAYKSLVQKYHPDKFDGTQEDAHRVMKILNEAYATLSDPALRKQHDEWIDRQCGAEQARADGLHAHRSSEPPQRRSAQDERSLPPDIPPADEPPPGRVGGLICLGLSLLGLSPWGLAFFDWGSDGPHRTINVYIELGFALWAAFFAYLSYWFYSGKANPRFWRFRVNLTLACLFAFVAFGSGIESGPFGWKTMLFGGFGVYLSVATWKEYWKAQRNR